MGGITGNAMMNGIPVDFDKEYAKLKGDGGTSFQSTRQINLGSLKAMKMGSYDIMFKLYSGTKLVIETNSVDDLSKNANIENLQIFIFRSYSATNFSHSEDLRFKPSEVKWGVTSEALKNKAQDLSEHGTQLHSCFFNDKGEVVAEKYGLDQDYDLSTYEGALHLGMESIPLAPEA